MELRRKAKVALWNLTTLCSRSGNVASCDRGLTYIVKGGNFLKSLKHTPRIFNTNLNVTVLFLILISCIFHAHVYKYDHIERLKLCGETITYAGLIIKKIV